MGRNRRANDPPRLQEVLAILALPKPAPWSEEEFIRRPREFGQKSQRWIVEAERKGPFLYARLVVGDHRVLGIDRHVGITVDPVAGVIGPFWYHWDVGYPFTQRRIPLASCQEPGHDADRLVIDHMMAFWHVSFEDPPKGRRLL